MKRDATKDGRVTDIVEMPDYAVRQRAVEDGWKLRRRLPENGRPAEEDDRGIVIQVSAEVLARLEKMRGAPLPPGCFEIVPKDPASEPKAEADSKSKTL